MLSFQACGKFILAGEHFVLYDLPALVMPWLQANLTLQLAPKGKIAAELVEVWQKIQSHFPLSTENDLGFSIRSNIPQGSGFGSSAALCLNMVKAAASQAQIKLTPQELIDRATEAEAHFHGRSSGVDPTVIALQKPLRFRMGHTHYPFSWAWKEFGFVLAVSQDPKKTSIAVEKVRNFSQMQPHIFQQMCDGMKQLLQELEELASTPLTVRSEEKMGKRFGSLLSQNHNYLREIGISSPHLEELIEVAGQAGAFGAKLTGAGMGGGMLAFAPLDTLSSIANALSKANAKQVFIYDTTVLQKQSLL